MQDRPAISSILLHVHADNPQAKLVETAVQIAKDYNAKLTIVDVVRDATWMSRLMDSRVNEVIGELFTLKEASLQELAKSLAPLSVESRVLDGPTSVALIQDVLRHDHDLVIRATKGEESRRSTFFGTTAMRLMRKCPCPVLVVKPGHAAPFKNVAAAVDSMNPDSVHAALNRTITKLAKAFVAEGDLGRLQLLSAWMVFGESALRGRMDEEEFQAVFNRIEHSSKEHLRTLAEESGLPTDERHLRLLHGDPCHVLPKAVNEDVDLLVMGSVGRAGLSGVLMGNTAEQILDQIACSVLVIKPEGFVSPIQLHVE